MLIISIAYLLYGCNIYKNNRYSDKIVDKDMRRKYINDSLKFGLSYFGDYDLILNNFNFKKNLPNNFLSKIKKSIRSDEDEILFVGKTIIPFYIHTIGICYKLDGIKFDDFLANLIAKNQKVFKVQYDTIQPKYIPPNSVRINYQLIIKGDKYDIIEGIVNHKKYAIRIIFLESALENQGFGNKFSFFLNEADDIMRSFD